MLEIRNLLKKYKTKGGAEVRALDGVSLCFEEKGMVFLLGKSGSGKSTLLNLCGGLDTPDSGEIVIKGKSSKDFSQADFDSYRNTFIGFVFQEYNILNEFTVEDNIALALELQGRSKDRKQVAELLRQVDLSEYAKRKPNTLSGGQKQRVAIARALIKNPEIIMADEPTGALDSNTGKQVFETLKKLSREKLVIVVSHDREFAEEYGDRIIELKDGKIESDVIKTRIAAVKASENVSFIGKDTISVRKGTELSKTDVERINQFLLSAERDVIISSGEKEIGEFRRVAHIDEEGARESFRATEASDVKQKTYRPEESRFIRSKLPARHAIRIGASSMKVKPFRLVFTVFLSLVAFVMFGLFSTLTFYNKTETALETYLRSDYEFLSLQNNYRYTGISYRGNEEVSRYEGSKQTLFTPADLHEYREEYGDGVLGIFNYVPAESAYMASYGMQNVNAVRSEYYNTRIRGFGEFVATSEEWQNRMLTETDLSALGPDDIIISSYLFESLKASEIRDIGTGAVLKIEDYDDIVGTTVALEPQNGKSAVPLTIQGVYRMDMPEKYEALKGDNATAYGDLRTEWSLELEYGLYSVVLVSDTFYEAHQAQMSMNDTGNATYIYAPIQAVLGETVTTYVNQINMLAPRTGTVYYLDGRTTGYLGDKEVVWHYAALYDTVQEILAEHYRSMEQQIMASESDPVLQAQKLEEARNWYGQYIRYNEILTWGYYYDGETSEYITVSQAEIDTAMQLIAAEVFSEMDFQIQLFVDTGAEVGEYEIVGLLYGTADGSQDALYLSDGDFRNMMVFMDTLGYGYWTEYMSEYTEPSDAMYASLSVPLSSENVLRSLLYSEGQIGADETSIRCRSVISVRLDNIHMMIDQLEQIFLWVGIVMAAFAMLLLFNFISVSISSKQKEIGILRAVGARSADVFKIFYAEAAMIASICFILSVIASYLLCGILNTQIAGTLGAAIFVFGPLSALIMLGIAVVTSVIATFIPVYGIARRKPVESIRAL